MIVLVPELLESAVVTVGGANGTVDPCPLAWVEDDLGGSAELNCVVVGTAAEDDMP